MGEAGGRVGLDRAGQVREWGAAIKEFKYGNSAVDAAKATPMVELPAPESGERSCGWEFKEATSRDRRVFLFREAGPSAPLVR